MRDVIDFCGQRHSTVSGYILSIDQEKAFDKIDRDFLFAILQQTLRVLYTNNVAHINGFISDLFLVDRSAKQGCPISSNL